MTKRATKKPAKATSEKVAPAVRRTLAAPFVATSQPQSKELALNDARFDRVLALIETARNRAYQAVNSELVTLYWQLGAYISQKITSAEWGDDEVVEYALARTTSPTLVAEYQTMLSPKALLRQKLHELYAQLAPEERAPKRKGRRP